MIVNFYISTKADFESILENASFPLTKAELIQKAKMAGVSLAVLNLIYRLPSRFYHSRRELVNQFINRSYRTGEPLIVMPLLGNL